MVKKYETQVIIDAQTKGFDQAQQKASKLNSTVNADLAAQAKGFAEAEKRGALFERAVGRIGKTFAGTGVEMKKYADSVIKEFKNLDKVNLNDVQKQLGSLQDELSGVYKEQEAVTKVMVDMADKASPAYEKLENHTKALAVESRILEGRIHSITKAYSQEFKEAERAAAQAKRAADEQRKTQEQMRGAFVQGLAQGGLPFPAPFLQRGPGMGRQVAGMAIGSMVSGGFGAGRALGQGMFGGVQGFTQTMAALPLAGPALAGKFARGASYAQQYIQLQQQRLELAPQLVSPMEILERREAQLEQAGRSKAVQEARAKQDQNFKKYKELQETQSSLLTRSSERLAKNEEDIKKVFEAAAKESKKSIAGPQEKGSVLGGLLRTVVGAGEGTAVIDQKTTNKITTIQKATDSFLERQRKSLGIVENKISKQLEIITKQNDEVTRAEEEALTKVKIPDPFQDLGKLGAELLGVGRPQAEQFFAALVGAGGGYKKEAAAQGMLTMGAAAKTVFGIGPEVSGAFLQAGRRGGITGMAGTGGEMFQQALSDAMKAGLEESEINNWMQQVASGIQNFQNTGIPINPKSITSMAADIARTGITGTRAMSIAQGLGGKIQEIGRQGPMTSLDLYLLHTITGYTGTGGAKEYIEKRKEMERLGKTVGTLGVAGALQVPELQKVFQTMAGGPGSDINERIARVQGLLGPTMGTSLQEAEWIVRYARGEMTPEQILAAQREEERRATGAAGVTAIEQGGGYEGLAKQAIGAIAPGARQMAYVTNQQIEAGRKMSGVVLQLERMATDTATAFANLAGEPLKLVVGALDSLEKQALDAAVALHKVVRDTIGENEPAPEP